MVNSLNKPSVTICIPVFNDCRRIGRSVESALSQTYENTEVVVSDNGSDDGTQKLLRAYDDKATILYGNVNHGLLWNWRRVLLEAKGDYIVILGSDDYLHVDYIADLMRQCSGDEAFVAGCTRYVQGDQVLEFLYDPVSLSAYDEHKLFSILRGKEKINLLLGGAFKKELWGKMLPKKITNPRRLCVDRIAVAAALVMANGNFKLVCSAPYFKDRGRAPGTKSPRNIMKDFGRIKKLIFVLKAGLSQLFRDLNFMNAVLSSGVFFQTVVMLEGITMGKRVMLVGEWIKWTLTRYAGFSIFSVWRIRIKNYLAVHRQNFG